MSISGIVPGFRFFLSISGIKFSMNYRNIPTGDVIIDYLGMHKQYAVPRQQICNAHTELEALPVTQAAGDSRTVRNK